MPFLILSRVRLYRLDRFFSFVQLLYSYPAFTYASSCPCAERLSRGSTDEQWLVYIENRLLWRECLRTCWDSSQDTYTYVYALVNGIYNSGKIPRRTWWLISTTLDKSGDWLLPYEWRRVKFWLPFFKSTPRRIYVSVTKFHYGSHSGIAQVGNRRSFSGKSEPKKS